MKKTDTTIRAKLRARHTGIDQVVYEQFDANRRAGSPVSYGFRSVTDTHELKPDCIPRFRVRPDGSVYA